MESPVQPQVEVEQDWYHHGGDQGDHQKFSCTFASEEGQDQSDKVEQKDNEDSEQGKNTFELRIHGRTPFSYVVAFYGVGRHALRRTRFPSHEK